MAKYELRKKLTGAALVVMVIALLGGPKSAGKSDYLIAAVAPVFFIASIWLPTLCRRSWDLGCSIGGAVVRPVPSPAEIAGSLEAEWGRPATVQEVAAVHQMLTSAKNQALVEAGIGFGALYLIGHHGKV